MDFFFINFKLLKLTSVKMEGRFTLRISQIIVILSLELYHNFSLNENQVLYLYDYFILSSCILIGKIGPLCFKNSLYERGDN